MKKLLAIDDEYGTRLALQATFKDQYEVTVLESAEQARQYLQSNRPAIVILDIVMPDEGGLEFLEELKVVSPGIPILMVTASSSQEAKQKAMRRGATGFINKPFDIHDLRNQVSQAITASEKPRLDAILAAELEQKFDVLHCSAKSLSYRELLRQAKRAAENNKHVILQGETGTGKELLARQIHYWRHLSPDAFIKPSLGHLEVDDFAQKLFGGSSSEYKRGPAVFDLAEGGTIYLDRFERFPPDVRSCLGKVLKGHSFHRVDDQKEIPTETVLIFGSSEPDSIESFSEFKDSIQFLCVPPLRERRDDIPSLAEHFLGELRTSTGAAALQFSAETMQRLQAYDWPGNLRELRNVIERATVLFSSDKELDVRSLPTDLIASSSELESTKGLDGAVARFEAEVILKALNGANGNVTEAARQLDTTPRKLQYRLEKLGIK